MLLYSVNKFKLFRSYKDAPIMTVICDNAKYYKPEFWVEFSANQIDM